MLRSCKYCGKIHDVAERCAGKKAADEKRWASKKDTPTNRFRHKQVWRDKSLDIRWRDQYLCLCCRAKLPGTLVQYQTENLSVHHITPLVEDFDGRLDDANLITVCDVHHEMCERGDISRDTQRELVRESMERASGAPVVM